MLDALAARGRDSHRPRPRTAHAVGPRALFTGTFPTFHGVRDNSGSTSATSVTTLAEMLKGHGYRTGGFVGAFVLDAAGASRRGSTHYFDKFDL